MPTELSHRGFRLFVADGFDLAAARAVADLTLANPADRQLLRIDPEQVGRPAGTPRLMIKAEFLRLRIPLSRRFRRSRASCEAAGYAAFEAAGIPVPRLVVHGEQSRFRPRGGEIVCTEKVTGPDGAIALRRMPADVVLARAGAAIAKVHAAGLVHGDAALRNFVLSADRTSVLDLPRWGAWTAERAEDDLAHVVGSALAQDEGTRDAVPAAITAYREVAGASERLAEGWAPRVLAAAERYKDHLNARTARRIAELGYDPHERARAHLVS